MKRAAVVLVFTVWSGASALAAHAGWPVAARLRSGQTLQARVVAPGIVQVRLVGPEGFTPSLLERYGIVRTDWPGAGGEVRRDGETLRLSGEGISVVVDTRDGAMRLENGEGKVNCARIAPILSDLSGEQALSLVARADALVAPFRSDKDRGPILGDPGAGRLAKSATEGTPGGIGFGLVASLGKDERFYGLGTASKQHIQLRGGVYANWVRYKDAEQPVPFLMSTAGWGLFLDTTWRHYVDLGKAVPDEAFVFGPEGDLGFFLFAGAGMPQILDRYTQVSGRPMLLPQWAYGLTWINHYNSNQKEVMDNAREFRRSGIPCDGMGLEPGWMKKEYDFSTKKAWNTDRFYIPDWLRGKWGADLTFLGALKRRGFKVHLWLCGDFDLTDAEERESAQREGRTWAGTLEPWFDHLKGFLDDGVAGFKLDPARYVDTADPSRQYANGRSEYEVHNVNPVLWAKQIREGQAAHTGLRPMLQYCGGWAGTQRYTAQTVGDIGGGPDGLAWELSAGLSGYMNTSGDMWINPPASEERWHEGAAMHFGFLSAWSLIDGWAFMEQPWWSTETREAMVRDYARLRYRLLPYIYSAAHEGHRSGLPIMRAMPLVFPEDAALADSTSEWMLGDSLLATAFSDRVTLPAGLWIDYWTGKGHEGPATFPAEIPQNRGGGLFVRGGAILPMAPEMEYVGHRPMDRLELHVYPQGESRFRLSEDDGLTLGHEKGEVAETEIVSKEVQGRVTLSIGPRVGSYSGMPASRVFDVVMHDTKPLSVTLDGKPVSASAWSYDGGARAARVTIAEEPERKAARVLIMRTR
jgi:alpha-glucosidase